MIKTLFHLGSVSATAQEVLILIWLKEEYKELITSTVK